MPHLKRVDHGAPMSRNLIFRARRRSLSGRAGGSGHHEISPKTIDFFPLEIARRWSKKGTRTEFRRIRNMSPLYSSRPALGRDALQVILDHPKRRGTTLLDLPPVGVGVQPIITHHHLALIRDVGSHPGDELQIRPCRMKRPGRNSDSNLWSTSERGSKRRSPGTGSRAGYSALRAFQGFLRSWILSCRTPRAKEYS